MAVLGVAGTRRLIALSLLCTSLLAAPAHADDDDKHELAIGETKKGVYDNKITAWGFSGKAGQIVTIRFSGKRAKQMGVVMIESEEHMGEWITGHSASDFASTGNVRDGNGVRLQLRLPKTARYHVHLEFDRDSKAEFGALGSDLDYTISVDGASAPGKAYVRGSIAFMMGGISGDVTPYGFNGTLAVGQRRGEGLGVEGVLSGSLLPADSFTVMALLGVGVRISNKNSPVSARYAVGVTAMTGEQDGLGGGIRFDLLIKKVGFGMEGARVGRANILLGSFGLAF